MNLDEYPPNAVTASTLKETAKSGLTARTTVGFVTRIQWQEPNLRCVDLTMGMKWMQNELPRLGIVPGGFTNCGFTRGRMKVKPHLIGDFSCVGLRSGVLDLVLFDPPYIIDKRTGTRWVGAYKWLAHYNFGTWKSSGEMRKKMYLAFREIERILAPNGLLVFKWGSGSKDLSWALRLAPKGLRIERIHTRPSRGGRLETTWHVMMRKRERRSEVS